MNKKKLCDILEDFRDWWQEPVMNRLAAVATLIISVKRKETLIMTQQDDLKTKVATLLGNVGALGDTLAKAKTDLDQEILDLKAAIASGGDITQQLADLDTANGKIGDAITALQGLDTTIVAADPGAGAPPAP